MNNEEKAKLLAEEQRSLLIKNGLLVAGPERGNYCYELTIKKGADRLKVLTYFGKTGNKVLIQGNKESETYSTVHTLLFGESLFNDKVETAEPEKYIGTDESGKGDFFGPLIVAGVYVTGETAVLLKKAGVKDSKLLSDFTITKLVGVIKSIIGTSYNIVIINPERYNTLYDEFKNLNRLLGWAHARVLENILNNQDADTAISDKFGDERYIIASLQAKGRQLKLLQFPRAEKYTAVAAASILARGKMLEWFDAATKKYGIIIPKGASGAVEAAAKKIKETSGSAVLDQLTKKHFKTTLKL